MRKSSRLGFTLVELLVVIAIIGILVGLLLPAVQAAREAARRMSCGNNLKQLSLAVLNYESSHKRLPSHQGGTGHVVATFQRNAMSGWYEILPYLEQSSLYNQLLTFNREPWNGDARYRQNLSAFECPSDSGEGDPANTGRTRGRTSYGMCTGDNYSMGQVLQGGTEERNNATLSMQKLQIPSRGMFGRSTYYKLGTITDGLSNTIMLAERSRPATINDKGAAVLIAADPATYVPLSCQAQWTGIQYVNPALIFTADTMPGYRLYAGNPFFAAVSTILPPNSAVCMVGNGAVSPHWFGGIWSSTSEHTGGVQVALGDGSVRFVSQTIDSGNLGIVAPAATAGGISPYGAWGALGTKGGSEVSAVPE